MNNYPIAAVNEMTRKIRRIGLGVMGFADMLVQLEVGYNTEEGLKVAEEVMEFIHKEAKIASEELAAIRGVFLAWEGSIYDSKSPYFAGLPLRVRNGAITTIAPTGTTSMLADASSGIEPYFGISYAKNTIEGKRLFNTNEFFLKVAQREGFYSEELLEKIEANHGSVQGLDEVPLKWQKVFVVSHDIAPEWHLKVQASFQKHVDNAISKTINFSHEATVDDVRNAYMLSYELGCKGITIYRDGSREKQILEVKKDNSYFDKLANGEGKRDPSHYDQISAGNLAKPQSSTSPLQVSEVKDTLGGRPAILRGRTYKINTPVGEAYITINRDERDQPFEVFITVGKAGMHTAADAEAVARMISLALRTSRPSSKIIAYKIVSQLQGIGGSSQIGFGKERVMSLADAVAKTLAEELSLLEATEGEEKSVGVEVIPLNLTINDGKEIDDQAEKSPLPVSAKFADLCPQCGQATFVFAEGCKKCHSCGYSMC
jgi:ribonucleoside-diphosphate reductase alpha chain